MANGGTTRIQRTGRTFSRYIEEWFPNPFIFAILLTFLVYIAGVAIEGEGPMEMTIHWAEGLWDLLTFSMQVAFQLIVGFVLAYHPRVVRVIRRVADWPSNSQQAVIMVGVFAMLVAFIHFAVSLIAGAILARETAKRAHERGIQVHYPLLCVAGFMGLGLTWHWGLSGTAPLWVATEGNEVMEQIGRVVPVTETVFSTYSLILFGLSVVYGALCLYLITPPASDSEGITEYIPEDELNSGDTSGEGAAADGGTIAMEGEGREVEDETMGDKINNSRIIGGLLALMGFSYIVWYIPQAGLEVLDINFFNFLFLFIGFALYTRPEYYREEFYKAVESSAGVILQFPFYAGIMGMVSLSGLGDTFALFLIDQASADTLPVFAWLTAAFMNAFVPSGGGEFAIVGPPLVDAAHELDVPMGKLVTAYSVGDAHTNLFNPFWAIPLLGITRVRARDMFGYAILMLLLLIPFLVIALLVVPYSTPFA